jgi:hypothetical protein
VPESENAKEMHFERARPYSQKKHTQVLASEYCAENLLTLVLSRNGTEISLGNAGNIQVAKWYRENGSGQRSNLHKKEITTLIVRAFLRRRQPF